MITRVRVPVCIIKLIWITFRSYKVLSRCSTDKVLSRKSVCQLYEKDANIQRNTLVNIFNCPRPSQSSNDITLVTQLTSDRIDRLLLIMDIWKGQISVLSAVIIMLNSGPISASVYPDTELSIRGEEICLLKKQDSRCRVQLHLVQKSGVGSGQFNHSWIWPHLILLSQVFFPVNTLRNIALDMAVTSHVFLTDVDFIPDQNVYENALQQLHSLQGMQVKNT